MAIKNFIFFLFLFLFAVSPADCHITAPAVLPLIPGGSWMLLQSSIGISAMHMQLLHNDKVVMFDRTDFGSSNLSLPANRCRYDPTDVALKYDCTAHSLIYDVASNTIRPLMIQTDTWCSSGSILPNGTLVQTGGYSDGDRVVRTFSPCSDNQCDWTELPNYLSVRRWYASNQILPDGRIIIVGGRRMFNYEFYPRNAMNLSSPADFYLPLLKETRDPNEENNLYPFLHLLPDGNLFVFANTRSCMFDYVRNRVVREFPEIPGGDKRNYPSTGSSVLLPIILSGWNNTQLPAAEVMVCGGAPPGSFYRAMHLNTYVGASKTCGRLKVTDPNPIWVMEEMPMSRIMSDMLLLPTGDVLIINGAGNGTAGWENAANPVLNPVLYLTWKPDPARRFQLLNPSPIPRLYHSAAILIPDGRILVGGSNPHRLYNFTGVQYPTELSLESFSPYYLDPKYSELHPSIVSVGPTSTISYGQMFSVTFIIPAYRQEEGVSVTLLAPSFSTHSYAMNQRIVMLHVVSLLQLPMIAYQVSVIGPTTSMIAPPGYYMLFVVHSGIPSHGAWVNIV